GLESIKAALAIYNRLLEATPSVNFLQEQASAYGMIHGEVLTKLGRPAEARATLERSREVHRRLAAADRAEVWFRDVLAGIHLRLGDLARPSGQPDEARAVYNRALVLTEELMKAPPDAPWYGLGVAENLRRLALVDYAAGRLADAANATRR